MNAEIRLQNLEEARVLLGPLDRTQKLLCRTFQVQILHRDDFLRILGEEDAVCRVQAVLERALQKLRRGHPVSHSEIERWVLAPLEEGDEVGGMGGSERESPRAAGVGPRSKGQGHYMEALKRLPLVLSIGPAGTGKTFLAVAQAVADLRSGRVRRIVLTRPAVEAGEKLGFLPGDYQAKVNPYLRPLYDALSEIMDTQVMRRYLENDIIEVCPLAFMRGRTLNQSYLILDEAQNTTISQMRMFLTRMGEGSRVVVTGDVTQVDLPKGVPSGLVDAVERLRRVQGLTVVQLGREDIVRHSVVSQIVEAYENTQGHMPSPEDRRANPVRSSRRHRRR